MWIVDVSLHQRKYLPTTTELDQRKKPCNLFILQNQFLNHHKVRRCTRQNKNMPNHMVIIKTLPAVKIVPTV